MDRSRRDFLKITGLSVLGLGVGSACETLAAQPLYEAGKDALTAKRWAMAVDQKKCLKAKEGCKDCVNACHKVHNVPDFGNNPKEEVKWIWLTGYEHAFPGQENEYIQGYVKDSLKGLPFVVLCNHCDNPPCVRVCPVKATFKRADGIVMMDYHRCIGCRFCMAACPYGARSLNWRDPRPFIKKENLNPEYPTRTRGVVEKCTFCFERLAKGLKPACVDACKEKALIFGDVSDPKSEIVSVLHKNPSIQRKPQLGTRPMIYYIL